MYNIAIVGDLHIDTKVSSRKDDYFQTCLQKINEVTKTIQLCTNNILWESLYAKVISR